MRIAAAVVAVLVSSGCALQPNDNTLPGQVGVGDDGYTVHVDFEQVENLVPNSTVQLDNVVIGTVASIEVEDFQAVVELRLLRDVPLSDDSVFSVGQKTLLGAQYVEVTPPADGDPIELAAAVSGTRAGLLQEGDTVPASQTGTYPATEQVLGAVALLLNNGGLSQISTITGELGTALRGRTPDARDLVVRTNRLLSVLDANRGEIVRALESLGRLSEGLASDKDKLARAIERVTPGLQTLEEERRRLVNAVTSTGRTGDRAVGVIQASQRAILANLDSLGPILTNLGKVSDKLPEALKIGVTIPFPVMTTQNAVKGDYANLFATLDLRLSSLATSFLGPIPSLPAIQAGDPLLDPLRNLGEVRDEEADPSQADPGADNPSNDSEGDGRDKNRGTGRGADSKPGSDGTCVLQLLGLC